MLRKLPHQQFPLKKCAKPQKGAKVGSPGKGNPGRGDASLGSEDLAGTAAFLDFLRNFMIQWKFAH